jgi:hypothetical protein
MTTEQLMAHVIEWSGYEPGYVTCALSIPDIEEFIEEHPEETDVDYAISFDALTESLIEFCGFDGVVSGADEIVINRGAGGSA